MTVLLAGGNAALQQSIAGELAASGDSVRVFCEDAGAMNALWRAGIEPWSGTSIPPDMLAALDGGATAVIVDPAVVGMSPRPAARSVAKLEQLIAQLVARRVVSHMVLVVSRESCRRRPDICGQLIAELNRSLEANWSLLQSDVVYGTGEDPISRFLMLMRSLPAVPIAGDTHRIQPVWHEDLALAVAALVVQRARRNDRVIEVAGPEAVTCDQLYAHIARLIGRQPLRVRVPPGGSPLPFCTTSAAALPPDGLQQLGVTPTRLEDGLRRTITELAELTPAQGVGRAQIKRFAIDMRQARYTAPELMRAIRSQFRELMPIAVGVEPAAPHDTLDEGAVITMAIPGRGHVAIRVEQVAEHHVVVSTLRGHVVAGFVRFATSTRGDRVGFEVIACDTAANVLDWITLTLGAVRVQDANWLKLVRNVAKMAGGEAGSTYMEMRTLTPSDADAADCWISSIIRQRRWGNRPEHVSAGREPMDASATRDALDPLER